MLAAFAAPRPAHGTLHLLAGDLLDGNKRIARFHSEHDRVTRSKNLCVIRGSAYAGFLGEFFHDRHDAVARDDIAGLAHAGLDDAVNECSGHFS